MQCVPSWSTRRRYERPTWGPYWGRVAAALGRPYMPWQQLAADIAGEVDERGRLCYSKVVVTVPRQSGKTTLVLPVVVGRAEGGDAFGGRQTMLYAAQKREAAKKKWLRDYVYSVKQAKSMAGRFKVRVASGSEELAFFSSSSTFGPIATQEDSAHGEVLDLGILDEAFSIEDNRVMAAWRPAMSTRPMAQIWIISTMGDIKSIWFHQQVDEGRESTRLDTGFGTAYVEYSAPEDATNYGDPDLWWSVMPALGRTQTVEFTRTEYNDMPLNDFRRAYLNQRVDASRDQVLPAEQWGLMLRTPEDAQRATSPILIYDVAYDQSAGTIALAYELADGTVAVRIAEHGSGTSWMVESVLRLKKELEPRFIVADGHGPVTSVTTELKQEYVQVRVTDTREYTTACSLVYDGVKDTKFVHYGERVLNKAVQGASRRELGDAWAWTRKRSQENAGTDISPLVAITLGYWAQTVMGEHADHSWEGSFG